MRGPDIHSPVLLQLQACRVCDHPCATAGGRVQSFKSRGSAVPFCRSAMASRRSAFRSRWSAMRSHASASRSRWLATWSRRSAAWSRTSASRSRRWVVRSRASASGVCRVTAISFVAGDSTLAGVSFSSPGDPGSTLGRLCAKRCGCLTCFCGAGSQRGGGFGLARAGLPGLDGGLHLPAQPRRRL